MPSDNFPWGYSASDLMTIAQAKRLPAIEERYRELEALLKEADAQFDREIEGANLEDLPRLEEVEEKRRRVREGLEKLKGQMDHAARCAEYVVNVLKRDPW